MLTLLALAVVPAFQGSASAEEPPVVREEIVGATVVRAQLEDRGAGFARLEELPQSPRQRSSAGQLVPWQIVRRLSDGAEDVIVPWRHPRWPVQVRPAQSLVVQPGDATASLPAGTFLAADRDWRGFVVLPGGAPARFVDFGAELDRALRLLTPRGVLHAAESSGGSEKLWWTPFDLGRAKGVGESRFAGLLYQGTRGRREGFVRHDRELLWISGRDEMTALDLDSGATRTVPFPGGEHHTLERAHHGWLFSRVIGEGGELRLTSLASGEQLFRPAPQGLSVWIPEGVFVGRSFLDPVTGERVELKQELWQHGETVRTEQGEVYFRARREEPWRRLLLDEVVPREVDPRDGGAYEAVARALDDGTGLEAGDFVHLVRDLPRPSTRADIALLRRLLQTHSASDRARPHAAELLAFSSHAAGREALLEGLPFVPPGRDRMRLARGLASFGIREDARAIERAIPVDSLPQGTRHGDAAVDVAEILASLGDEGSVPYLEALYERAPFPRVQRALHSVRNADRFLAAMAESRGQ